MNKRIIYPTANGGVAIFAPASECDLTIDELATLVVPEGVVFKVIDSSEIPTDRTFRDAWEYDDSDEGVEETPVEEVPEEE